MLPSNSEASFEMGVFIRMEEAREHEGWRREAAILPPVPTHHMLHSTWGKAQE